MSQTNSLAEAVLPVRERDLKAKDELVALGIEIPGGLLRRWLRVSMWIMVRPFYYRINQLTDEGRSWMAHLDLNSQATLDRVHRLETYVAEIDGTLDERWYRAEQQLTNREAAWLEHIHEQAVLKSDLLAITNRLLVIEQENSASRKSEGRVNGRTQESIHVMSDIEGRQTDQVPQKSIKEGRKSRKVRSE